jgi:class 3 adenylate cyclase
MGASFRALFVAERTESHALLTRMLEGSDVVIDAAVSQEEVIASVALRTPDLIVFAIDAEVHGLADVCRTLKANPVTVSLPLLALARNVKTRMAAFDAGVDEFMTHQIRREEFLVRVNGLLRAAASRRQLAAEQLAEEVKRREVIRLAFRRYISPKVADRILENPELRDSVLASGNLRARASVMFADMRGFTAISERLAPTDVVDLLNQFFGLLTDITFEYDGTIFNMAGDSLLVGFGVPVEQADGPARAIAAARQMLLRLASLADRWKLMHDIDVGLGIGIHVGEVIAGNVGSASYMNFTIIGDTVNVAARLAQRARAGEMLFSEAVKSSLDGSGVDVAAMALPPIVLRGRSNPIDIFCVPSERRIDFRTH